MWLCSRILFHCARYARIQVVRWKSSLFYDKNLGNLREVSFLKNFCAYCFLGDFVVSRSLISFWLPLPRIHLLLFEPRIDGSRNLAEFKAIEFSSFGLPLENCRPAERFSYLIGLSVFSIYSAHLTLLYLEARYLENFVLFHVK